jgi:hypothetical protein
LNFIEACSQYFFLPEKNLYPQIKPVRMVSILIRGTCFSLLCLLYPPLILSHSSLSLFLSLSLSLSLSHSISFSVFFSTFCSRSLNIFCTPCLALYTKNSTNCRYLSVGARYILLKSKEVFLLRYCVVLIS